MKSAYETLLPTHAGLARVVNANIPRSAAVATTTEHAAPSMRKYVIVLQDGAERLILFSREIQHRSVVPAGARPVSAGFVLTFEGRAVIPAVGSDSLSLDPRPQDKQLIEAFLS
jgi:hypothetical protein